MNSNSDVALLSAIDWHDSKLAIGTITRGHQPDFPDTICYDGHLRINIDLTYSLQRSRLRLVFAGCRHLSFSMYENMSLHAIRVTGTHGAAMVTERKDTCIDASALLYESLG